MTDIYLLVLNIACSCSYYQSCMAIIFTIKIIIAIDFGWLWQWRLQQLHVITINIGCYTNIYYAWLLKMNCTIIDWYKYIVCAYQYCPSTVTTINSYSTKSRRSRLPHVNTNHYSPLAIKERGREGREEGEREGGKEGGERRWEERRGRKGKEKEREKFNLLTCTSTSFITS